MLKDQNCFSTQVINLKIKQLLLFQIQTHTILESEKVLLNEANETIPTTSSTLVKGTEIPQQVSIETKQSNADSQNNAKKTGLPASKRSF